MKESCMVCQYEFQENDEINESEMGTVACNNCMNYIRSYITVVPTFTDSEDMFEEEK